MPGISRAGVGRSKVKPKRFIKFYYYKYRYYPGYHISRYYQLPSMPCRPAFIAGGQNISFTLPPGAPYHSALSIRRCLPSGQKDVLELTRGQLLEEGIFICQHKTNKKQIKAWSDRLRAGIAMAEALPLKPGLSSLYVLHQSTGGKYTRDASIAPGQKRAQQHLLYTLNVSLISHFTISRQKAYRIWMARCGKSRIFPVINPFRKRRATIAK